MTCLIAWKHSAILYLISSFNCIYHKPQLISFSPLFLSWSWFLTDSFFYFRMTGRFSVIHCYVQVKLQQVCWGLVWALTFTQCLTGFSIFNVMVKLQGKQVLPKPFSPGHTIGKATPTAMGVIWHYSVVKCWAIPTFVLQKKLLLQKKKIF